MHTINSLLVLIVFNFIFMHSVSIFATTNADFVRHLAVAKKYDRDFVRDVSANLFNQPQRQGELFYVLNLLHVAFSG